MKTIERNYKTNAHKASFLLAFHTAGAHNIDGQVVREVAPRDLLAEIPVEAPAYEPTEGQRAKIIELHMELADLDAGTCEQAVAYTTGMDVNEAWTPENTSRWITNLIAKVRELRAAAKPVAPVASPEVPNGRYAVEHEGTLKFFQVRHGKADTRWAGFVFLDVQASDETYPIKNRATKTAILALIAADVEGALCRYGRELGVCGDCGRTLTDAESRAIGRGPICRAK